MITLGERYPLNKCKSDFVSVRCVHDYGFGPGIKIIGIKTVAIIFNEPEWNTL